MRAIGLLQAGNGLVRGVLAGNMATTTANARLLVYLGDDLIVDVQVLPIRGVAHRPPGKRLQVGMALGVHPARQAILHFFNDAKPMQHRRRAHLHRAAAQGDEFRGVAPGADTADAADRQAVGLWVTGDFGDHVQRNRLDRRAAVTTMGALGTDHWQGDHALQVHAGDGVDGVDQRHRIGAAAIGRPRRHADVGDVRRELDDHRQRTIRLAPARHLLHVLRHLADGGAHAPFGHAMRAAEVQFDAVAAGRLHQGQDVFPGRFDTRHHERDDQCAVRPVLFHLGDFP